MLKKQLAGKDGHEKNALKIAAFKKIKPSSFVYEGIKITISEISEENSLLKIVATASGRDKDLLVDNPLYFKNPPIMVPDGTFTRVYNKEFNTTSDIPNMVEDLDKALQTIVGEVVKSQNK